MSKLAKQTSRGNNFTSGFVGSPSATSALDEVVSGSVDEPIEGEDTPNEKISSNKKDKEYFLPSILKKSPPDSGDDDNDKKEEGDKQKKTEENKQKKTEEKSDREEEFIPESFDIESVVTSKGTPISKASKDVMKKFKESAAARQKKIDDLTKEIELLKSKSVDASKLDEIEKDREMYKRIVDERYFEESPDFIRTFIDPISEKSEKIQALIKELADDGVIPNNNFSSIDKKLNSLEDALKRGKRGNAFALIKGIEEDMDGPAARAVTKMLEDLVPLYENYNLALKDKQEARKLVESERGNRAESTSKSLSSKMKILEDDFMDKEKKRIEFFRSKEISDLIEFDKRFDSGKEDVMNAIKGFASSGEIDSNLAKVLFRASLFDVNSREIQVQGEAISAYVRKLGEKEKEITELKEKLQRIRGVEDKGRFFDGSNDDDEEEDDSRGTSAIYRELLKLRKK